MFKFGYRLYDCNEGVSYAIEISQALYTAEEGFVSSYQRWNVYVPAGRCFEGAAVQAAALAMYLSE